MKKIKVLYVTNIQSPYRVEFLNQLSELCDLRVLYERECSNNRNEKWASGENSIYTKYFLNGVNIGNENSFSLRILKYIFQENDIVLFGCCNSIVEIFAMVMLKLMNRPFALSLDGDLFITSKGLKSLLKRIVIKLPKLIFCAGEQSAEEISKFTTKRQNLIPYYFSSLTSKEILANSVDQGCRDDYVLVIGQYYDYKGMDIAAKIATMLPNQSFKFIGTGKRTEEFIENCNLKKLKNVLVIPFLEKDKLFIEYKKCKCLLLPTRQECWGLVVNEASSFGTPIVSTYGSGAAKEFLFPEYELLLANSNDAHDLKNALIKLDSIDAKKYSFDLIEKSKKYNIEKNVKIIYMGLYNFIDKEI